MTELGEGVQYTRRRASLTELESHVNDEKSVEDVLKILVDARLVTTDKDSVEVAHEALIREWRTLQEWLEEDRANLLVHHHLAETAKSWDDKHRDVSELYRGTRLAQTLEWANTHTSDMSHLETEYLKACQAEQRRERRAVQISRGSILGILLLALVLVWLVSTGSLKLNLTFIYPPIPGELVVIPAGNFVMGSNNVSDNPDESPAHSVFLNAYAIQKYELTNKQYYQCVKAGVCIAPRNSKYNNAKYADHPVTDVNWFDAENYCKWIGERLPTEAEWEKSARGPLGSTYPWGEMGVDNTLANYGGNVGDTTPVGSYMEGASAYGVYDLAGNVWEWVADLYYQNTYSFSSLSGQPESGYRVLRGGSWYSFALDLRSTLRDNFNPSYMGNDIGFRCASDVSP